MFVFDLSFRFETPRSVIDESGRRAKRPASNGKQSRKGDFENSYSLVVS